MKRLTLSALMVLGAGSLFALPTFNPMRPALLKESFIFDCSKRNVDCCRPVPPFELCSFNEWCSKDCSEMFAVSIGYYGDFVFDRKMKINDSLATHNKASMHNVSLNTNAAQLEVGFWDRFMLFGVFGSSNLEVQSTGSGWNLEPGDFNKFTTNPTFAWGVGGNAILYSTGCVAIGFSGSYFETKPEFEKVIGLSTQADRNGVLVQTRKNNEAYFKEWQVALGASYWIHVSATGDNALVPYFNIKYADSELKPRDRQIMIDTNADAFEGVKLKSDLNFGYAVGATYVAGNKVSVTVEGRWNDETALHANAAIRF